MKGITELPNNRYLVQVYLTAKATIPSDQTTLGEDIELLGNATLIYNSDGLVEYASSEVSSSSQYNSVVATSDGGQIAVGQMKGKLHIPAEQTSTGEDINLLSNGNTDALIAKYNQDGNTDWVINLGGTGADVLSDIIKKDNTYIAVGKINGNLHIDKEYTSSGEDIDITRSGDKGILLEVNEEGKVITVKVAQGGNSYFDSIQNLDSGEFIVGSRATNNFIIDDAQINYLANTNMLLIEFNNDNSVRNLTNLYLPGSTSYKITTLDDGGIVIVGTISNFNDESIVPSEATTIGEINIPQTKGSSDAIIVRLNLDKKIEFLQVIQPINASSADQFHDVVQTIDGGYLALWHGYTGNTGGGIKFTEEETASGEIITSANGQWSSFLIKYNSNNKVEWIKNVGGNNSAGRNLLITIDNGYMVTTGTSIVGYSSSFEEQYKIDSNGVYTGIVNNKDNTYTFFGYQTENGITTAKIAKLQENTISAEIPEQQELAVENYKKEYKITTEVEGTGGSISGQGSTLDNPYEIVKYGGDSTKDIVITPEPGYKVLEITVNGEKIEFTPEEDGSVILNKFVNMTSDKHVVVKFSNSVSTVIVHHYKDGTTEKLAEDELLTGEIGTNYTTAPKTDITDYEVVMEKLPSNASGQYTEAEQHVIYYYKQIPVKLIVHHYLEETEEIVPGSEDDQINEERERNSEYTTSPATGIDAKYELVATPINSKGKLTENETVVTYYYRVKDSAGVIVHHIDTDTKEEIAPDVIIPANGTGKYGDSYTTEISKELPPNYEYVTKTDNWEGTMMDKLTEVTYEYKLVDPTVRNGVGKTATLEITSKDDEITYDIAYRATIENYIGKAQVTILDTIPYAIDMSKSTLNGGTYNAKTNTITWKEIVEGIDTYENPESGEILINKTIKVVYTNVDTTQETIVNNVSGQVKLLTPEKTSEKVTDKAETLQNYKVNVTVNKVWADNEIQAQRRPEKIKFTVTANGKDTQNTYEMNVASESSYTFTNLDKYDSEGNTITYGIKETVIDGEEHEDDLKFYETSETKNVQKM